MRHLHVTLGAHSGEPQQFLDEPELGLLTNRVSLEPGVSTKCEGVNSRPVESRSVIVVKRSKDDGVNAVEEDFRSREVFLPASGNFEPSFPSSQQDSVKNGHCPAMDGPNSLWDSHNPNAGHARPSRPQDDARVRLSGPAINNERLQNPVGAGHGHVMEFRQRIV